MPLAPAVAAARPVAVARGMSASALRTHIATGGGPLLLPGLAAHWPATRWDTPDLAPLRDDVGEHTAVDVEVAPKGRGYLDPAWQRVTMGFGLFLDAFVLNRIPSSDPTSVPGGYLAQAPVHDLPRVNAAAPELEHYAGPEGDTYHRALWVGPRGSFTPFHRDPNVGLYTHVVGYKVFHLLPPAAERWLQPSTGVHRNTSTVPVSVRALFAGAEAREPAEGGRAGRGAWAGQETTWGEEKASDSAGCADAFGTTLTGLDVPALRAQLTPSLALPGACTARLGPGDSLLIPEGWWHSAEGESVGVGVNAWFR